MCYLLCEYFLVVVHTTTNPSTLPMHVLNLRFPSKTHPPPELLPVIKIVFGLSLFSRYASQVVERGVLFKFQQ